MEKLVETALSIGATRAKIIDVDTIPFNAELRTYCEQNSCGAYGKNYMCPPACGEINELIEKAKSFKNGLLFSTVYEIEDKYDFEGMSAASKKFEKQGRQIKKECEKILDGIPSLMLGAGGCSICKTCGIKTDEPCRFPEDAFPSVEAHGIYCFQLLQIHGMPYNNGEATVTYIGLLLYEKNEV